MNTLSRRRFLATSAGLTATSLLGCRGNTSSAPEETTTFYGDTFDAFAASLYGELRKKDGNVFLSPYSISTALAMTAEGARGNTLSQMQKALGLPADKPVIDALAAKGTAVPLGKDHGYELAVANALWPQPGYNWSPEYMKRVRETFKAAITETDFAKDPEAARKTINTWVEKQTRDKIKELLASGTIDKMTRLVLTNAIYFKGDWLTAFDKAQTREAPFTLLDGTKKNVPLMHREGTIEYAQTEDAQVISLPYKGKQISFIGVLPKDPAKFADLDAKLSPTSFANWTKNLKPATEVNVWLPKFKVEAEYGLNGPLQQLGMVDAFKDDIANFNGMTTDGNQLYISLVQHKAFVDVDEEGTVAAAATGVVAREVSERFDPIFRADRPFLFALRHEPTGTLLFLGRYSKP